MESENGVSVEDEKRLALDNSNSEGSSVDVNKENIRGENEVCKDEIKEKEGVISSGPQLESSASSPKTKISAAGNVNGKSTKSSKLGKKQSETKPSVAFGRSKRPSFSQSLSFPARGRYSDPVKRSVEVNPVKEEAVKPRRNGVKDESKFANAGSFKGKTAGGRRATLDSLPSVSQTVVKFFFVLRFLHFCVF